MEGDKTVLLLDVPNLAQSAYDSYDKETKQLLQAYADGVNAFVKYSLTLPLEFQLAGADFEPWEPIHTAQIAKSMEFRFLKGWTAEITRDFMTSVFEEDFLDLAYPSVGIYEAGDDDGVIITDDELKDLGLFVDREPCPECNTQREPIPEWYDDYLNPDNDFSDF